MERTITPDALKHRLAGETPPVLLDVRRADDRAREPVAIPGAAWHDPSAIATWASTLDPGREVVVAPGAAAAQSPSRQNSIFRMVFLPFVE